jgi:hypothetical protein
MRLRAYSVYQALHIATGRVYVGMSASPRDRWYQHVQVAMYGADPHPLYAALRQCGAEAFDFLVLKTGMSADDARDFERITTVLCAKREPGVFNVPPRKGWPRGLTPHREHPPWLVELAAEVWGEPRDIRPSSCCPFCGAPKDQLEDII